MRQELHRRAQRASRTDPEKLLKRRLRVAMKIQDWAAENGGVPPTVNDLRAVRDPDFIARHGRMPSYLTAIRYSPDGTWDGMIRFAGFEPRGRGRCRQT